VRDLLVGVFVELARANKVETSTSTLPSASTEQNDERRVNAVYHTARAMAAKAIPTFPCVMNGKSPLTPKGFYDATTDPALLEQWARRWQDANLGMPTGLRSGFVVLDIDRKSVDGLQTLTELEKHLGRLPETLTATTPSGGEHRYFRAHDATIRSTAGRIAGQPAPGLDVRGEGGYVLVSPSIIDGRSYVWRDRVAPAELPASWLEALRPTLSVISSAEPWRPRNTAEWTRIESWCVRALQREARKLAGASRGSRNDSLWRASAALGGLVHLGAIEASDVRRALEWACSTWGDRSPSKDADTIERGIAFGLAHPRRINLKDDGCAA